MERFGTPKNILSKPPWNNNFFQSDQHLVQKPSIMELNEREKQVLSLLARCGQQTRKQLLQQLRKQYPGQRGRDILSVDLERLQRAERVRRVGRGIYDATPQPEPQTDPNQLNLF